jgi:2-keto-3-deoxy-L-rhamnonate aldolase RhmA
MQKQAHRAEEEGRASEPGFLGDARRKAQRFGSFGAQFLLISSSFSATAAAVRTLRKGRV